MKSSRDVALIIMFTALVIVFRYLIGQFVLMVANITFPGFVFLLSIFFSVIQCVSFLMFKGRRWRFLALGLLSTLLYFVFINPSGGWGSEMAIVTNYIVIDVVFNSFYGSFERKNRLLWLTFILQLYYWIAYPFLLLFFATTLFVPFESYFNNYFVPVFSVMLPVILIEALAGSYLGYKIYRRVEKIT
jgi:hypothetical protein